MKKYLLGALFLTVPLAGFCQQMTWVGNAYDVQNQVTSLRQWGCHIYCVTCQNPHADTRDQRWVIVYEQN